MFPALREAALREDRMRPESAAVQKTARRLWAKH
jgi:hypothetical protein